MQHPAWTPCHKAGETRHMWRSVVTNEPPTTISFQSGSVLISSASRTSSLTLGRVRCSNFFPRASERRVLPIVGVCISSSHLHTFSSSHLLSHLLIFTSSHLHTFSSSHLLIFTSAHLHICSSSHLFIFTSSHTHIFTFSLSHSHLHILTSSLSLYLSLSLPPLSSLLSLSLSPFSLPFLSLAFFIFLFRPRVVPAGSHETSTLSHEMRVDRQKLR